MSEDLEKAWLRACQRQIEDHLQWGPVARWSQRDFENLSELISEKTGVLVSVTTLKRALGRVGFKGMPFHSTLNALVQFLGHTDWAHFKSHPEFLETAPFPVPAPARRPFVWFGLGFGVLVLLNLGMWGYFVAEKSLESDNFARHAAEARFFTQDGKSDSIPHSCTFEYSIPKSLQKDVLFVSFGEGKLEFARIDSQGRGRVSHRYTDYGYYPVKLFSNRNLVALAPVLITNPTWWVGIHKEKPENSTQLRPVLREGVLTIQEKDAYRFATDTLSRINTQFRRFQDFGVDGDNCSVEFRIRCPANAANRHSPKVDIKMAFRNESAHITLDKSNTAKTIYHKVGDFVMPSRDQIRFFQQDISDWSVLTFENHNRHYTIRLNDRILYQGQYQNPLGPLYGLNLRFVGIGEIDHVLVYDHKHQLIVRESF